MGLTQNSVWKCLNCVFLVLFLYLKWAGLPRNQANRSATKEVIRPEENIFSFFFLIMSPIQNTAQCFKLVSQYDVYNMLLFYLNKKAEYILGAFEKLLNGGDHGTGMRISDSQCEEEDRTAQLRIIPFRVNKCSEWLCNVTGQCPSLIFSDTYWNCFRRCNHEDLKLHLERKRWIIPP